jgi:mannan endo-1,4-beta-mannosidase
MSRTAKIGMVFSCLAFLVMAGLLVNGVRGIRVIPRSSMAKPAPGQHRHTTDCGSPRPAATNVMRIGVALGGSGIPAKIKSFAAASGAHPSVVEIYRQFGGPFSWTLACTISRDGALPLIDLDPARQPVRAIAAGRYDSYLRTYARQVTRFKSPLAISFGHEMNGDWYPWGGQRTSPADFIAAWRHIHQIFSWAGASNVTWVWAVATRGARSTSQAQWWPGAAYVDWVGLDAYYRKPNSTFGVIVGSMAQVRAFAHKPVLITETAVAPGPHAAKQVTSLFIGVASHSGLIGFVWFDQDRQERWRIESDPAARRVFRREVNIFL